MKNLQSKLAGYKTYIVGVITAVLGVINIIHVGHFSYVNISAFVAAGGLSALRAGVSKVEKALKAKK